MSPRQIQSDRRRLMSALEEVLIRSKRLTEVATTAITQIKAEDRKQQLEAHERSMRAHKGYR